METSLTFFYTGDLRGDLDILPRLYTLLKSLRARVTEGRTLYVDIGGACVADVWHCDISGGRSMVIVLDGMGCAAANVSSSIDDESRAKMGDNTVIALVDAAHDHVVDELAFTLTPPAQVEIGVLAIVLAPDTITALRDQILRLGAVRAGQIGMASVENVDQRWGLTSYAVHDLPANTPPDPTITAAVDFVLSEARYTQKRRGN